MRSGGGKRKGTEFERDIAKSLSLWITLAKRDDVLWRSAISGGRTTAHYAKQKKDSRPRINKEQKLAHVGGDICAIHPLGAPLIDRFFLELKFYRDLNLGRALTEQEGLLIKFWLKACEQAKRLGKHPLLVFKENRGSVMVGTTVSGINLLGVATRVVVYMTKAETLHIFPLDSLLACYSFPREVQK